MTGRRKVIFKIYIWNIQIQMIGKNSKLYKTIKN